MLVTAGLCTLACLLSVAHAAPPGFPASGNALWYTQPAAFDKWVTEWLPVGNGHLAATLQGGASVEFTQLNIEDLWSGGPFQDPTYNGGNKAPSEQEAMKEAMAAIREDIFASSSGTIQNIDQITTDAGAYGSYVGAGYLVSSLELQGDITDYFRWLDMDEAVHKTSWTQANTSVQRETFCSHPAQACTQHTTVSGGTTSPNLTYAYSIDPEPGLPTPAVTCFDNSTLQIRGTAGDPGMAFEILARIAARPAAAVVCAAQNTNATLTVTGAAEAWITWVGGTDYDMDAGDAAHGFSFKGADPHDALVALLDKATASDYASALAEHTRDYSGLMTPFSLDLGQEVDTATPTDQLQAQYKTDVGDRYFEWLLFNFGRYLLAGSARGTLPANLQGKWGKDVGNPWGADYHSNINIQMNYWFAEQTGMDVVKPLFDMIERTWAPRGAETARVLYNIDRGWVTHNEMNIFGHTGMKGGSGSAQWSDYPESAVWMMIHVWDHFDFTNDVDWFQKQGYPLLKGVAQFHLDKLIPDEHFNDTTLVTAPCNSPEQSPITFGCAHAQQLVWQLFNAIEKGFTASGDTDATFLEEVRAKRASMDKGIHIGSWGQLQEWKFDMDRPDDIHRHLSHLVGLYPGYAVSGYSPSVQNHPGINFTQSQVLDAAQTSLIHRGNGTADSNAGWEKVWRAACWAALQNATEFFHQLSYSIEANFGPNLHSLYPGGSDDALFQIDANFGYTAAALAGIIHSPDSFDGSVVVYVLPALPAQWDHGSVNGARVRGGISVDIAWRNGKLTLLRVSGSGQAQRGRQIRVIHKGATLARFTSEPGMVLDIVG